MGRDDLNARISDELLVSRAASGDEDAINRLVFRYASTVQSRASGYYGTDLSPEDLAQEGMIGFLAAIRRYTPDKGASFRTFAILCIDRSIISAVRSVLAKGQIPLSARVPLDAPCDGDQAPAVAFTDSVSAEDVVFANEARRSFEKIISERLSESERRVLLLRLGGCSYDDISLRLSISKKSVDNILYRVRKKLKSFS